MMQLRILMTAVMIAALTGPTPASDVEIVRDRWGVAHVFAESDESLFYGAGFAMAEDRLLQMLLLRSEAEGRISEVFGAGEDDRFLKSDRLYRLLGFSSHAQVQLANLQDDSRRQLEAFAEGVNAFLQEHPERLSLIEPSFSEPPRQWSAADCLTLWSRHAYQFTSGWEREVEFRREYERWQTAHKPGEAFPAAQFIRDDSAAIVPEEEFRKTSPQVYEKLKQMPRPVGTPVSWFESSPEAPKASHNWVISSQRSTTGKPILESNPQIPVTFPNWSYEIHLCGGRYDVRGIALPGTPGILVGWNQRCAWGVTALGGDHADLFEERLDPQDPGRYLFKNESRPFVTRQETIAVRHREPVRLTVRQTLHGPVMNEVLEGLREGETYALRHIILASQKSSLESKLAMMRATNWASFREGMREYVAPATHLIFADDQGTIAYQTLVSTPKRSGLDVLPRQGWTGHQEWETVPFDELPSMVNPASQTIFTANHLPIGSWYPYVVSTSRGEGPRSWRLRELLAGDRKLSPADFHEQIHKDPVNPPVRDFVTVAIRVAREEGEVSPALDARLTTLENWGGRMATDEAAYPLARSILDVLLKEVQRGTPFVERYGPNWNGLNWLIRDLVTEFKAQGQTPTDPKARTWLNTTLRTALADEAAIQRSQPPVGHQLPYQGSTSKWGSRSPQRDLISPPLTCPVPETIWSQGGETYVQIVDLSNIDQSLSLLPPGISENPDGGHATDQIPLWIEGRMHPAPLSRKAVLAVQESSRRIKWPAAKPGTPVGHPADQ